MCHCVLFMNVQSLGCCRFACLLASYVYDCFAYMYVCLPCECLVSKEIRRGCQSPGTRTIIDGVKLCGCWNLSLGPLQEQQVFC